MSQSSPKPQLPSQDQLAALISILQLNHEQLHQSARTLLTTFGDYAVPMLRKSAQSEHMATRSRSRAILRDIHVSKLLQRLQNLDLGRVGRDSVLALFAGQALSTQVVRTFMPDSRRLFVVLRRHANALATDCVGKGLHECVGLLTECIHAKMGLRGVAAQPLALDHYVVHKAVQSGIGGQITLALIYLMVARWAGLHATVVKSPDQYLIRVDGPRPIMVDPLLGGRITTRDDCARAWGVGNLHVMTDREVLLEHLRALWGFATSQSESMSASIAKLLGDGEPIVN